jgi:hypothetical protein
MAQFLNLQGSQSAIIFSSFHYALLNCCKYFHEDIFDSYLRLDIILKTGDTIGSPDLFSYSKRLRYRERACSGVIPREWRERGTPSELSLLPRRTIRKSSMTNQDISQTTNTASLFFSTSLFYLTMTRKFSSHVSLYPSFSALCGPPPDGSKYERFL